MLGFYETGFISDKSDLLEWMTTITCKEISW